MIDAATERATKLTQSMLTYSRKQPVNLRDTDANEIVSEVKGFLETLIPANVTLLVEQSNEPLPVNVDKAQIEQLQQALNQLKTRYRNVLILMYFEGYDYEEISDILNLNYGNCRTLVSRAKEQLKQKMITNDVT